MQRPPAKSLWSLHAYPKTKVEMTNKVKTIDRQYIRTPFYGSRSLAIWLGSSSEEAEKRASSLCLLCKGRCRAFYTPLVFASLCMAALLTLIWRRSSALCRPDATDGIIGQRA